jgi:ATP-binding cassette subfamily B (MDR/TAP) protein 1
MFAIIDRKSKVDSLSSDGTKINEFNGNIEFRDVRFAYPSRPDVPVLHGLNLRVPAGKTTALVGTSGSGKSTLFGLLERWYLHSHGSITLDGHSIDNLNLQWLRTNIRLVQQEPTLFSGTIYQNVVDGLTGSAMASLPEDEKRNLVEESCKSAFAHEFIQDMPQGYDTVIGERGASLSGGQKQRIVIARSIISNPKVLLLDEATSALDPKAEKIVQQALNNVAKGRTMVVIAHRLSTIRDADNIIVMKQGQMIEQGSHNELVELGATYARLVQAQDLGQGKETKDESEGEGEGDEEGAAEDLDRPVTTVSVTPSGGATAAIAAAQQEDEGYGLFKGMYYIIKEQTPLWTSLFITILCAIAGGMFRSSLFRRQKSCCETSRGAR